MQDEYENALKGDMGLNKKIKLGESNDVAYDDLILTFTTNSSVGKVAFGLVENAISLEFPDENCKIAWINLFNKYATHTASSISKLISEFHIS